MFFGFPFPRGWKRSIFVGALSLVAASCTLAQQSATAPAASSEDSASLQTAQQANARLEELAKAASDRPRDTTIGPGDLIHVDVFDVPDLSRDARVSMTGEITLPLVPTPIQIGGLTAFQAQDEIAKRLIQYGLVTHPQVSVMMKEQHSGAISVVGAVLKPGVYQEMRPITVLEALAMAGGLANDAGSLVVISREVSPEQAPAQHQAAGAKSSIAGAGAQQAGPHVETISVDLNLLLESGNPTYNIPVHGGDILTVPHAGIVYVAGAVQQSGGFTIPNSQDHMTILRAMALAHGPRSTAKLNDTVIIRKGEKDKTEQINVHLKDILNQKAPDLPLYANDVLFIPDSSAKKALYKAADAAISVSTGVLIFRGTQ